MTAGVTRVIGLMMLSLAAKYYKIILSRRTCGCLLRPAVCHLWGSDPAVHQNEARLGLGCRNCRCISWRCNQPDCLSAALGRSRLCLGLSGDWFYKSMHSHSCNCAQSLDWTSFDQEITRPSSSRGVAIYELHVSICSQAYQCLASSQRDLQWRLCRPHRTFHSTKLAVLNAGQFFTLRATSNSVRLIRSRAPSSYHGRSGWIRMNRSGQQRRSYRLWLVAFGFISGINITPPHSVLPHICPSLFGSHRHKTRYGVCRCWN